MDFETWPEAPIDDRPKPLYVAEPVTPAEAILLAQRGWEVVDVRTMPNKTDGDRLSSAKAKLEGLRVGSIEAINKLELEALKLEMTSVGPKMGNNGPLVTKLDKTDLDLLMSFQSRRAFDGAFNVYDDFLERVTNHVSKRRRK